MIKRVSPWATAVAVALLPSAVLATAVVAETIEEMARAAPTVVRGTVQQVQVQLDSRAGQINTYADIQVTQVIKGSSQIKSVLVKSPGGEIYGRGDRVAGAAHFVAGQDTVLFLEPAVDESGVFIIRSLAAGKVDFERSGTGQIRAVRHLEGIAFFGKQPATLRRFRPEQDLGTPDAFLHRISLALKAAAQ